MISIARSLVCCTKALLALAVLATLASDASAAPKLQPGDRVVFYGDSITEQRLYTRYLQQFVTIRYPNLDIRFFNAGWGGDTAPGALRRLERDVLVLRPTVVTLFFGMNDGHYKPVEQATLDEYRGGMTGLIERLQKENIRVIVYTPGVIDYDKNEGLRKSDYNATLKALGDICRELGEKYKVDVIDVHQPMLDFQAAAKKTDPNFTMIPDSVHPNEAGHLVMAGAMLPALAEPVAPIGEVDIASPDSSSKVKVMKDDNGWTLSTTLPTPFWIEGDSRRYAYTVAPYVLPKLMVKNLPAGKYAVEIGGFGPVTLTAEQLAAGIPVGTSDEGGKAVHDLTRFKEDNYFNAWRNLRLPLGKQMGVDAVYAKAMETDEALVGAIRAAVRAEEPAEIRIRPAPAGENLAKGKPYEASDPNVFGWGMGGLTDGSWEANGRHCFATGDKEPLPKSVTVDLQKAESVAQIIYGVPPFGSTKTVALSISEDGKSFKEVDQHVFTQSNAETHRVKIEPANVRYVRLTYLDRYTNEVTFSPTFAFTSELEVYGPETK